MTWTPDAQLPRRERKGGRRRGEIDRGRTERKIKVLASVLVVKKET